MEQTIHAETAEAADKVRPHVPPINLVTRETTLPNTFSGGMTVTLNAVVDGE